MNPTRTAHDVMTGVPVTVSPSTTCAACAEAMRRSDVRHLVVTTATGALAGLVSDTAVFQQGAFDGPSWVPARPDLDGASIASVVRAAEAVARSTPLPALLARLLEVEDDAVVIVGEGDAPVGLFTELDAVRLAASELTDAPTVQASMATVLVTGTADTPLQDAWELLEENGIRHLPIRAGSRVVGIASIRDLMLLGPSIVGGGTLAQLLADAPGPVLSTLGEVPLRVAAERMAAHRVDALPVIGRDGALDGLVTATDVIRAWRAAVA